VVPRAGLKGCGNSRSKLGFDIQPAQLVASHYTDYAILVHRLHIHSVSCCVVFLLRLRKIRNMLISVWCLPLSELLAHCLSGFC